VYASIVPRGWGRRVKAVTLVRAVSFALDLCRGAMLRGCCREETWRDPDDARDATWSWSGEIADWVIGESCVCRSTGVW
jgi:hypothetical protein